MVLKKLSNRKIATVSVFVGLMAALTFGFSVIAFPQIIPGLGAAFLFLIVVDVATLSDGLFTGVVTSFTFGLMSLITSFVFPTVLSPLFHNPLISVLPRVFMGVVVFFTKRGLDRLKLPGLFYKTKGGEEWESSKRKAVDRAWSLVKLGVAAGVGALYNTVSVLGLMMLFYRGTSLGSITIGWPFIATVISVNAVAEFFACLLLTPGIVYGVLRATRSRTATL